MDAEQLRAFETANGGVGDFTAEAVMDAAAGILVGVMILWLAWVVVQVYRAWSQGRALWGDAGGQVARAFIVFAVVLAVVSFGS